MGKSFLRIIDFIKSWIYYPKMVKYIKKSYCIDLSDRWSRFEYAWWHCHVWKLK